MPWAAQIQKLQLSGTDAEGDIKALVECTQLTSVNFYNCNSLLRVTGDIKALEKCTQLKSVDMSFAKVQGTMELSSSDCGPVRFSCGIFHSLE